MMQESCTHLTNSWAHPWWHTTRWCGAGTTDRWPRHAVRSCWGCRCPPRRRSADAGPASPDESTRRCSGRAVGNRWRSWRSRRPCAPWVWAAVRWRWVEVACDGVCGSASVVPVGCCSADPVAPPSPLFFIERIIINLRLYWAFHMHSPSSSSWVPPSLRLRVLGDLPMFSSNPISWSMELWRRGESSRPFWKLIYKFVNT